MTSRRWLKTVASITTAFCMLWSLPSTALASTFPQKCEVSQERGDTQALAAAVFDLINAERAEAGRKPLKCDAGLNEAAEKHTKWMAEKRKLSHYGDGRRDFFDRIRDEYPDFYGAGAENIFQRYVGDRTLSPELDAPSVVEGWMKSRGHRKNILDREKTHTGVAVVRAGDWIYVTQVFAVSQ